MVPVDWVFADWRWLTCGCTVPLPEKRLAGPEPPAPWEQSRSMIIAHGEGPKSAERGGGTENQTQSGVGKSPIAVRFDGCGGGEIRTLGGALAPRRFSKPLVSSTHPPLQPIFSRFQSSIFNPRYSISLLSKIHIRSARINPSPPTHILTPHHAPWKSLRARYSGSPAATMASAVF